MNGNPGLNKGVTKKFNLILIKQNQNKLLHLLSTKEGDKEREKYKRQRERKRERERDRDTKGKGEIEWVNEDGETKTGRTKFSLSSHHKIILSPNFVKLTLIML